MFSSRTRWMLLGLLAALVVILVPLYIFVDGGSGEPSEEVTAPTLPPRTPTEVATEAPTAEATQEPTEVAAATEQAIATEAVEVAAATEVAPTEVPPTAVPPTTVPPTEVPPAVIQTFSIVKEESEVRFIIHEELRGTPTTVIGKTNEVAGFIEVDQTTPANSRIGTLRINMRTLATDNDFRNRTIRSQILETSNDAYEFSDFVPTSITGMPASVTVGETFSFEVTGDLTIKGTPHSVTFAMTVTPVSETRLEGTGTATVFYKELGLTIPSVPGVANISDDVQLEIDFVAVATPAQ